MLPGFRVKITKIAAGINSILPPSLFQIKILYTTKWILLPAPTNMASKYTFLSYGKLIVDAAKTSITVTLMLLPRYFLLD